MVCTANQCRSPMAEALARRLLQGRAGPDANEDGIASAGVRAWHGVPATPEAQEVLARRGIDATGHRSRPVTRDLVERADLVLCMESWHAAEVRARWPELATRVETLDLDGDVDDPIGGTVEDYERCLARLEQLIAARLGADAG